MVFPTKSAAVAHTDHATPAILNQVGSEPYSGRLPSDSNIRSKFSAVYTLSEKGEFSLRRMLHVERNAMAFMTLSIYKTPALIPLTHAIDARVIISFRSVCILASALSVMDNTRPSRGANDLPSWKPVAPGQAITPRTATIVEAFTLGKSKFLASSGELRPFFFHVGFLLLS